MTSYVDASLRRLVESRANHLCEYCLIHEDDTYLGCQVDHVIAEKHGGPGELTLFMQRILRDSLPQRKATTRTLSKTGEISQDSARWKNSRISPRQEASVPRVRRTRLFRFWVHTTPKHEFSSCAFGASGIVIPTRSVSEETGCGRSLPRSRFGLA